MQSLANNDDVSYECNTSSSDIYQYTINLSTVATLINIQLTYLHAYKSSSGKNILDVFAKS